MAWRTRDSRPLTVRLTGRLIAPASSDGAWIDVCVEDVTDARRLEAEMRQAQKMEGIGRLAANIAHDFNNLLTAILGYADLLLGQIDAAKPMHADLRQIQHAGQRAAALTHQLLAYSRQQTRVTTILDVNEVVRTSAPLLRRVLGDRVVLVITDTTDVLRVSADRGQLEQVLMNLAINGRDAMPHGGTLTITAAPARVPEAPPEGAVPRLRPGASVRVSVTDTGTGMDAATQARIFEPFFSTKASGRGTGLGLTILDGIVSQLGGRITVTSALQHGSTFEVELPASDQAVTPCAGDARAVVDMGRETLLVVDDDPAVLALVSAVLTRHGYHVLTADTLDAALIRIAASEATISLMVIDVGMPGMTGPRWRAHLSTQGCPPTVYMSGYAEPAPRDGAPGDDVVFLAKPFTPRDLLAAVRRVMTVSDDGHRRATRVAAVSAGGR